MRVLINGEKDKNRHADDSINVNDKLVGSDTPGQQEYIELL